MEEEVKNSLTLDVLVNNAKVNVIELSGKLSLPLPSCSQKLEEWIKVWQEEITREYLVEGLDANGNGFIRIVSEKNFEKLDKKGTTSFLFSVEKKHEGVLNSSYRPSNSTYKRIHLTPELRDVGAISVVSIASEVEAKDVKKEKKEAPEIPTKKAPSKETLVSKFFSEKPKEKPKETQEPPPKVEKSPEVKKEVKSESRSDKDVTVSPAKGKAPPKVAEKKNDGKKGKAAPAGNKMITSFFTKVSKPAAPPAQVKEEKTTEKSEPEKIPEVAKKRPLSEEKSPQQVKKSSPKPQKKMKMSKKAKPKVKAGTSRILQIVDDDTSESEEERIDQEEDEEKDNEGQNVVLENEEVKEKTPPRPYKEKKKKTIRECYKDVDGYDNFILKQVDCSSEEE